MPGRKSYKDALVFEDSDVEEVEWSTVQSFKMPFGKHKGKTMVEMIRTKDGRDYLRYMCNWKDLRSDTKAIFECALEVYNNYKSS